ncbi:MAG: hypothetical protein PHE21_03135 [Candidatus Dojkabacteria bacterium]|nr:hypothetical protein [Candidatus Dojkabacteria bacterium]
MELNERENNNEREDIEYLQKELENTHYDLYRDVDKDIFTNSLEKASNTEPKYFKLAIQESLALLRDAHTHVSGMCNNEPPILECREIEGGIYIIGATENHTNLIGEEIKGINGHPVSDVVSKVSKLSSNENREVLLKDIPLYIASPLILSYYGFGSEDSVRVTTNIGSTDILKRKGEKIKTRNPLEWKESELEDPTFLGNRDYRLRIINNTLLFQYNNCTNEGHTIEELKSFKRDLLEIAKRVEKIVVDLRQNSGGNTHVMEDLFLKLPEDKKFYVAIGRKTFSSAMHHLLYLREKKSAVLIGENAGQKPNRFGDCKEIVLPNSKTEISCSYKYFELLPGQDIDVIEPEIRIPITIEDYKRERDPLNKWIEKNI